MHEKAEAGSDDAEAKVSPPTGVPVQKMARVKKANARRAPTAKVALMVKAVPKQKDRNKDVQAATAGGKRSPNFADPNPKGPDCYLGSTTRTHRGELLGEKARQRCGLGLCPPLAPHSCDFLTEGQTTCMKEHRTHVHHGHGQGGIGTKSQAEVVQFVGHGMQLRLGNFEQRLEQFSMDA